MRARVYRVVGLALLLGARVLLAQTATTGVTLYNYCSGSHTATATHLNGGTYYGTFTEPGCTSGTMSAGPGATTIWTLCPAHVGDEIFVSVDGGSSVDSGAVIGGGFSIILTNVGGVCTLTFSNAPPPPTNYIGCLCVTNTATIPITPIGASYAGTTCPGSSELPGGVPLNSQTGPLLYPGKSWCYCYTSSVPDINLILMPVVDAGGFSDNYTVLCSAGGTNTVTQGGGSGNGTPPTGGTNGVANAPGSGWGNNTNLTGQQYASGVSNEIAAIDGIGTSIGNGLGRILGALTNLSGGEGTNEGFGSNVWVNGSTPNSGTNYSAYGTNFFRTNAAFSDGATLLASVNVAGVTNGLIAMSNAWVTGTPSEDASLFTSSALIPGYTINLDPASVMPGVPALVLQLFNWLATLAFVIWCISAWKDAVYASLATHVGQVPDFEASVAGFGGNVLGWICFLVVPVALAAIWVVLLVLVLAVLSPAVSTLTISPFSGWTSVVARNALHLFNEFFDWPYIGGLLAGRIFYGFLFPWLAAVSGFASRLLPG